MKNKNYLKNIVLFLLAIVVISCVSKMPKDEQSAREPSSLDSYAVNFFNPKSLTGSDVTYSVFDLNKDIEDLEDTIKQFKEAYDKRKSELKAYPYTEFPEQFVSAKDLKRPYNQFDLADKTLMIASDKLLSLISQIKKGRDVVVNKYQIMQLTKAIEHKYTEPTKVEFEALAFPIYLVQYLTSPSIDRKATDEDFSPKFLQAQLQTETDIQNVNFYDYLSLRAPVKDCVYLKPKTGYGRRAGFQITCNGKDEYKVKFGVELYSGPFNSRIYRAVGYTVPQINYIDELTMKYDRRMLVEFNKRQRMLFKIRFAGIKVHEFTNKKIFDPFTVIKHLKLKNGDIVSAEEAKAKLLKDINAVEISDQDFINPDFEAQIGDIVYIPATLTVKNDPVMGEDLGHWDAMDLDYASLKEVRALMVVSAWIGNYDVRKDNLKLTLVGEGPKTQLKMTIGDAGAGLGKSNIGISGLMSASEIDDMKWTVSARYNVQGQKEQQPREVFKLDGLTNIQANKAFNKIKLSDAQWMLSKMCRITKDQLTEALVASGMSSAEVILAREKLLHRRNKMLEDFLVSEEIAKACHVPTNTKISYNPEKDGLVKVYSLARRMEITAPAGSKKIVSGKLVP